MLAAGVTMTACITTPEPSYPAAPYPGGSNVFLEDRPPRYGHQGTQSPTNTAGGPVQPGDSGRRGQTEFLNTSPAPREWERDVATNQGSSTPGTTTPKPPEPPPTTTGGPEVAANDPGPSAPEPGPETGSNGGGPAPEPEDTTPEPEDTGGESSSMPVATPVPGQSGVVFSPFAEGKKVRVDGIAPGTEVRCPYTQKIFLVP